jgi:hypothetical protein
VISTQPDHEREVGDLVPTFVPLGLNEPGEVVAVEVDAALGECEVVVHAEQVGEHAGRLALGVGGDVGERCAVQVLDPSGNLGGREVAQAGLSGSAGPGRPGTRRYRGGGRRQGGGGLELRHADGPGLLIGRGVVRSSSPRAARYVADVERGLEPLRVGAEFVRRRLAHVALRAMCPRTRGRGQPAPRPEP